MIEDSVMAAVFGLWVLMELNWSDPFERGTAEPGYAITLNDTVVQKASNGFELRVSYYTDQTIGPVQLMWDGSITQKGGTYAGLAARMEQPFGPGYFTASVGAGLWYQGNDADLGFPIVFRSDAEFGVQVTETSRVGFTLGHRSNANLGEPNTGIETVGVRYSTRF